MIFYKFISYNDNDVIDNELFDHRTVYVDDDNKIACLRCPCGCGDLLTLNLADGHPSWTIEKETIKPSIQRTIGCKSHFSIVGGVAEIH